MADEAESVPNDEEVWACLTSADLAADLADLAGHGAGHAGHGAGHVDAEVQRLLGEAAVISNESDQKIASSLQKLCAEAEQMQFNLASMVAKITPPGPLAPRATAVSAVEKTSGWDVQAMPPTLGFFTWPSGAQSLEDYEERLAAMPESVAITRDLQLSLSKLDCRQDEKDINRDTLEVNGLEVKGAEGGYHAAVRAIAEVLDHGRGVGCRAAAQMLLSVLNRTTSGFMAFEEVLKLLEADVVVISPESASARPLELSIVGGMALGRAHTRYAVHRADASGQLLSVDAFVCFRVEGEKLQQLVEQVELKVACNILIYKSPAKSG